LLAAVKTAFGIRAQQLEPVADVLGVPEPTLDPELGTKEGRGELGDELFARPEQTGE
jgi:hypothetical protein